MNNGPHRSNYQKSAGSADKKQKKAAAAARAGRRRSYYLVVGSILLAAILISRLYTLQIVRGDKYLKDFKKSIRRTVVRRGARGRILDADGKVLAETRSSYNITMNDLTEDASGDDMLLNTRIRDIIDILEENKESSRMVSDFGIELVGGSFYFKDTGETAKIRFLADVYGYADPADMPEEDYEKSAEDVIQDLAQRYGISTSESVERDVLLKMAIARYNLSLNYYQKYIPTVLARNVSGKTKKAVEERFISASDGVQVEEELVRYYGKPEDSKYYSNIVGYTGEADEDYLSEEKHQGTDENGHPLYREGDMIGLTGIEASQEEILHAVSGQETFNVDNIGRITDEPVKNSDVSVAEQSYEALDGRDVYLTIDFDLQKKVYLIIEDNLRKIILNKLQNSLADQVITQDQDGGSIPIPISNVYVSCLCNILDSTHFTSKEASDTEKEVAESFESFRKQKSPEIIGEIKTGKTPRKSLGLEMQYYQKLLAQALYDYGVLNSEGANAEISQNKVLKAWDEGTTSLHELIREFIRMKGIDTSCPYLRLETDDPSEDELYQAVISFFSDVIGADSHSLNDRDMRNAFYRYLIIDEEVSGEQVCQLLMDQKIVRLTEEEKTEYEGWWDRGYAAFLFMQDRIRDLDLTPAQLHLYPSTASAVVTDPKNGNVLALVSYPGYDPNRINDEAYYRKLVNDPAKPLLNYATQQLTAPGSTFKMVTATAALSEEVIDIRDTVECKRKGTFKKVKKDPDPPKCWIYPGRHKRQNLEGAIANSCNMYFYEMGYRLGVKSEDLDEDFDYDDYDEDEDDDEDDEDEDEDENNVSDPYDSTRGIDYLQKYAAQYGLDTTSGVEISESDPQLLTRDPIRGAIGQDTNAYSTAGLARYASGIANDGSDYQLTLIKQIQTEDGKLSRHEPHIEHSIHLEEDQWKSIHKGMRRVATGYSAFNVLSYDYPVAGKTGTAQQKDMPDNALFVGYAPYYLPGDWNEEQMAEKKKIAMAVRIPNGYTSDYAAALASDIFRCFYYPDQFGQIVDPVVLEKEHAD